MHQPNESNPLFFSSRWTGGVSLILGPLLLLTGILLRVQFYFFYPEQLAAFAGHPFLMTASYSLFAAGNLVLFPAVLTLAGRIWQSSPAWAFWGGILAVCGLFARTFHAGVDHLAFQLVRSGGVAAATGVIDGSYGAFHIFRTFNPAIMLGWIVLAIGGYRTKVLPLYAAVALAFTSTMPLGVLKGTTIFSVVAAVGLCMAFVPFGLKLLRTGPVPALSKCLGYALLTVAVTAIFFFIGQQG